MLAPLALRSQDDLINIDLVIANHQLNLLQRDADIAIRHVRPAQQDLVCRRISGLPFGLYASDAYLAERGEPGLRDLSQHWFIDARFRSPGSPARPSVSVIPSTGDSSCSAATR